MLATIVILLLLQTTVSLRDRDVAAEKTKVVAQDGPRHCYQVSFSQEERFDVPEGYVVAGFLGYYSAVGLCRPVVMQRPVRGPQ